MTKIDKNWQKVYTVYDMENAVMGNTSLNVSLPEVLKTFVKEQVATGRYSTPSDYVRELIRTDQKRLAKEQLDRFLLEGLDSPAEEVSPEYLEELRRDVREVIARKHAKRI
jgi:antitoxin ParD1/3/4